MTITHTRRIQVIKQTMKGSGKVANFPHQEVSSSRDDFIPLLNIDDPSLHSPESSISPFFIANVLSNFAEEKRDDIPLSIRVFGGKSMGSQAV